MIIIITFILGAIGASAIICARHRHWGYKESLLQPSRCNDCHQQLTWYCLIPIIGWFINLGRCSQCKSLVSLTYPLTELVGGLWALIILDCGQYDYALMSSFSIIINTIMLVVTGIVMLFIIDDDINHYRIRDFYSLIIAVNGALLEEQYLTSLIMGLAIGLTALIYRHWRGYNGLGYGDIKLVFALGLWLPLHVLSSYFISIGLMGMGWGVLWNRRHQSQIFPYGPILIISFISLYVLGLARFTNCGMLKNIILFISG